MSAELQRLFSYETLYRPISEAEARELDYYWGQNDQRGLFRGTNGQLYLVESRNEHEFRMAYVQAPSLCSAVDGFPWQPVVELEPLPWSIVPDQYKQRLA